MNALNDSTNTTDLDPTTTTTVQHDWDRDESITVSIVAAISRLSGADPAEVSRLYDRLDPDCLESLFSPAAGAGDRNSGHLWIPVDDYGVTVYADGTIVVQPLT